MSDKFDDIINDAFANSESEAAPEMAWNRIDDELQKITELDDKVKQSFEEVTEKAPDFVWEKVQDQLDIDAVWQKISARLVYRVKRTYLGYACVLLFLLLPFVLDDSNETYLKSGKLETLTSFVDGQESDMNDSKMLHGIELNKSVQTETLAQSVSTDERDATNHVVDLSAEYPKENDDRFKEKIQTLPLRPISLISVGSAPSIVKWDAPTSKKPKRGWIGGLTVSLDHTWILDRDKRAGFDNESLVENKFSIGNSAGLFFEIPIQDRFAFHGEYLFQCVTRQANQSFVNGTHTLKEKEIESHRMVLLALYNSKAKHNWVKHSNVFRFERLLAL